MTTLMEQNNIESSNTQTRDDSTSFNQFRDDVDFWIKQIRSEFSEFQGMPEVVETNSECIQENYESVEELKNQVKELKQELHLVKLMQLKFMFNE